MGRRRTYNVNADTAAGAIAGATGAQRMLMLTDVEGVLAKDGSSYRSLLLMRRTNYRKRVLYQGG